MVMVTGVNEIQSLDEKRTIPYATEVSKDPAPQYSGAETIKLLLNDLNEAGLLY